MKSARVLIVFIVLAQFCGVLLEATAAKRNFVFLLADDLGWADLKCYGSSFHETPQLDQLAREGMRFTTFYSAGSVCSPTRSSIMTGKYPVRTGITDWIPGDNSTGHKLVQLHPRNELALEELTVAEAFKQAGYQTFYAGKWHLGRKGHQPTDQGFDKYAGDEEEDGQTAGREERLKRRLESTERFTRASLQMMQERDPSKPFFLFLSYHDVHTPIQPMPGLVEPYQKKAEAMSGETPKKSEREGQTRLRQDNPAYASMLAAVDQSLGRLRSYLAESGLTSNTVVVFTSDNGGLSTTRNTGPTSNLPLRAGKGWLYEGGIRVPLIVFSPGETRPGSVSDEPLVSCDFYPTLLDMAGLPKRPEQHADGASFAGLLKGGMAPGQRTLFWHYPHYHGSTWRPGGALRDGQWKLIEFFENRSAELYDLGKDGGELRDLARENPGKTRELLDKLHAWQKAMNAKIPEENPDPLPADSAEGKKRKRSSKKT